MMLRPIPARALAEKVKNRLSLSLLRLTLKAKARSRKPLIQDYGWIKLPYSDDGDIQELYYHAHHSEYYHNDIPVISQYVRPGDCVIDVGANIGFVTTMLASLVGDHGKVYSFEPSAGTYNELLRTIEANGLGMVEPVNSGLGEQDVTRELYRATGSSGNDTLIKASAGQVSLGQVKITSLDAYLAQNTQPISFIKIDTEGYEAQVLRGATETLKKHRPVIYIELCSDYMESSLEAVALLRGLDYRLPMDLDLNAKGNGSNFVALPT